MLKALFKKQFLELGSFYFQNRKTGKRRSAAGIAGYSILYAFVFISLGIAFYGLGFTLCMPLHAMKLDWLYFSLMGIIAMMLGIFGAVFNTYAGLYQAKDNELLLSMPIAPWKILLSRLAGAYAMGLMFEALVLIPAVIVYWVNVPVSALSVVFSVLQIFIIGFFVLTLTCILGWVVALISSKTKSKSFVTVAISLLFIFGYYFVYFRINDYLQSVVQNAYIIEEKMKSIFYPFYLMGLAFEGKVIPMLIVTALVTVLTALTYLVLAKSFIKITTTRVSETSTKHKEAEVKTASIKNALFKKELKHFTSSPTYMLNCGLGLIMAPILAVAAVINTEKIREAIEMVFEPSPELKEFIPLAAAIIICILISTIDITAPSVSLEGKNIWIAQSLPIKTVDILQAKQKLQLMFTLPCAAVVTVALSYVINADITTFAYMLFIPLAFAYFHSALGLSLNLLKPVLSWTNETVPIKQSFSVFVALFGGWIVSVFIGGAAYLLRNTVTVENIMLFSALIVFVSGSFINKWIYSKGAEIFAKL